MSPTTPQIEGVSYRGRVMVEIVTDMGKLPAEKDNPIVPNDVKAIEVCMLQPPCC